MLKENKHNEIKYSVIPVAVFMNMLILKNKVSQSITIVGHLFHCGFSVKSTLDNIAVNRNEEEKIAYFYETGSGCGSYRSVLSSCTFSL